MKMLLVAPGVLKQLVGIKGLQNNIFTSTSFWPGFARELNLNFEYYLSAFHDFFTFKLMHIPKFRALLENSRVRIFFTLEKQLKSCCGNFVTFYRNKKLIIILIDLPFLRYWEISTKVHLETVCLNLVMWNIWAWYVNEFYDTLQSK